MNVQIRVHQWGIHILRTFVTHLLVHMHQKEKIALEIAAKIARVSTFVLQVNHIASKLLVNTRNNDINNI